MRIGVKPAVRRLLLSGLLLLGALPACVTGNLAVLHGGATGAGFGAQSVDVKDGVVELKTPEAVSAADRYRVSGPNGVLIAYSLKAVASALSKDAGSGNALSKPEIWQVGGINSILGAIIDPATEDVVIVGRQDADLPPLTLDELITILRAAFVVHRAPFISIDPPRQTALLHDGSSAIETIGAAQPDLTIPAFQNVRTDGRVVDTQVGANMIDADFTMKLMTFGLLSSGVEDVDTAARDLSLTVSVLLQQGSRDRFEFYPDANGIYVDRLFVILAGGGLLAVRTERESGAAELAAPQRAFAGALSAHTRELAARHATIGNVYVYSQVYALAVGLVAANAAPYVAPLLKEHEPAKVSTVREIPQVVTTRSLVAATNHGAFVQSVAWLMRLPASVNLLFHGGGVILGSYSVTSTLRQKGLSLRSAILQARPNSSAIAWTYAGGGATSPIAGNVGDLIGISEVSVELTKLRRAVATGLVESVMALADRLFRVATQEAAIAEAARAVALMAILSDRERDGARVLAQSPPAVRGRKDVQALIGLLESVAGGRAEGSGGGAPAFPEPAGGSQLIWALAWEKIGEIGKACAVFSGLGNEFLNGWTISLALECADRRHDANALARYLALAEHSGMRVLATNYYRGEIDRLAGRSDAAAAWYYSYLGEELNPQDGHVKLAQAFVDNPAEAAKIHSLAAPAGYGVVVLIRRGEWAGSANGRLVTSQSGGEVYGRLGPGEFLVLVLTSGAHHLRLLGSMAIKLNKDLIVDVKAGAISAFEVKTASSSSPAAIGLDSGAQEALSCAQKVSGNSPMASGREVVGIALGCAGVGVVSGAINLAGEKVKERYDDFLIGPALDVAPIGGDGWRETINSLVPASPWGGASL